MLAKERVVLEAFEEMALHLFEGAEDVRVEAPKGREEVLVHVNNRRKRLVVRICEEPWVIIHLLDETRGIAWDPLACFSCH